MNKTFKVVFNKARGALMVANEVTSSVQKKGVKVCVAAALVAAALGSAQANIAVETADGLKSIQNQSVTIPYDPDGIWGGIYDLWNVEFESTGFNAINNTVTASSAVAGGLFDLYETQVTISDAVISGNTVNTSATSASTSTGDTESGQAAGGAVMIKAGTNAFKDTLFQNNVIKSSGKTLIAGGAIYQDAIINKTDGTKPSNLTIEVSSGNNLTYSGNNITSVDPDTYYGLYGTVATASGGFLFLDRYSFTNFAIGENASLTIGTADSSENMDSIASSIGVDGKANEAGIVKTGKGTMTINSSLDKFYGTTTVTEGTLNITKAWKVMNAVTVSGTNSVLKADNITLTKSPTELVWNGTTYKKGDGKLGVTSGSITISDGATLITKVLDASNGSLILNGGTLDATNAATLNVAGVKVTGTGNTLTLGENTNLTGSITLEDKSELETSFATAYSGVSITDGALTIAEGASPVARLSFANSTGGTLLIADKFTYDSGTNFKTISDLYNTSVTLNLKNATFNGKEPTTLVDGVIQSNATAKVDTTTTKDESGKETTTAVIGASTSGTGSDTAVTTGAQTIVLDNEAAVTVKDGSTVTLTGKTDGTSSAFIEKATEVTVAAGATLNLGSTDAAADGKVAKGTLQDLTLSDGAKLNVSNAEVEASALTFDTNTNVALSKATVTATAVDLGTGSTMSVTSGEVKATTKVDVADGASLNVTSAKVNTPSLTLTSTSADTAVTIAEKSTVEVGELTVRGSKATVTVSDGSTLAVTKTLTLGESANLEVKNATVSAPTLALEKSASVKVEEATVTADTLNLGESAELTVQKAEVITKELKGGKDVAITLGTDKDAGSLHADTLSLNGATIFLDPIWTGNDTLDGASFLSAASVKDLNGKLIVGRNSAAALGASKAEAIAAFDKIAQFNPDFVWGESNITAALFLGQAIDARETTIVVDGSLTSAAATVADDASASGSSSNVTLMPNSFLGIDQQKVGSQAVRGSLTVKGRVYLGITNASENELTIADNVYYEADDDGNEAVVTLGTDNPFVGGTLSGNKIKTSLTPTGGLAALASTGMQAMARRADAVLAQTIADRTSVDQDYAAGTALWVDVTGERYQADKLENNASFKSDMGYGAFGGDFAITEDISAGAAIQYGKGTVRSSVSSIKNSIDSYGITAYGSMKFGDAKVVAEASYIKNENDITSSQTALNQSVDTEVYSLGIRGQHRFTAGQFQFVPSLGVRVSRLNTDAMKVGAVTVKKQEQTLVQVPIALRINGFEQNAGGWSVAPSFKIAYVPTFGDKEISVLGADQTVIDTSPVQGDFGIRAQKGNLLLNANFMVGGGKDGTSSVGGKAGLKYVF